MRNFKFPLWLQQKLLPFFDHPAPPLSLQGDNLLALMFNRKLKTVTLNKSDQTITTTYQDDTKGLFIHFMSTEQFFNLCAHTLNNMLMDLTQRDFQENTVKNKKIGNVILPCDFHCANDDEALTLTLKLHS